MKTKQITLSPMSNTYRNRAGALGMLCLSIISSACDVESTQAPKQFQTETDPKAETEGHKQDDKKKSEGGEEQKVQDPKQVEGDPKQEDNNKPVTPVDQDDKDQDDKDQDDKDQDDKTPAPTEYDPAHLQYIVIAPGNQVIEQDLGNTRSLEYKAVGYYSDGKSKDISDDVEWQVSNPAIGSFNEDTLTLAAHDKIFVETAIVTAKLKDVESRSQLTVTAYEQDSANPDFLFVLPYNDKAGSKEQVLSFQTKIPSMDVFFSLDTTGSMGEERNKLVNTINSTIVPTIHSKISNTHFGVGSVQDFPIRDYGAQSDQPFTLITPITENVDVVKEGVSSIKMGNGWDFPESIFEGLYQIATGEGLSGPGPTKVAANNDGVGGVGFRQQTMPVIISVTDAPSHGKDEKDECGRPYKGEVATVAHSFAETEQALNKICARVITVASDGDTKNGAASCTPSYDGKRLAKATKTRVSPLAWDGQRPTGCEEGQCCTGIKGAGQAPDSDGMCPLVFNIDRNGDGLDASVVSGIEALAFYAPFDVITQSEGQGQSQSGVPLANGETTTRFIQKLVASGFSDLPRAGLPEPTAIEDRFEKVTPGTKVKFTIRAFNDFVAPTSKPQVFRAKIQVKADQCEGLELDEREVVFVVPPRALVAG